MSSRSTQRVPASDIRKLAISAWQARGGSHEAGEALVGASLEADCSGRPAVGLAHFVDYLDAIVGGRIDGAAVPVIEQPFPGAICCDARNGIAQHGFALALDRLAEAARTCGIAIFTLRNCYTAGEMGHYVRHVAERGLIGLATANASAMMAAAPGAAITYGTNPLAFAAPRLAPHPPLVFDQATSATAFVNIARAADDGLTLPAGWAADAAGVPTTDPVAAANGALLPFGGPKGANLALMVEVLSAGLGGGQWSMDAGHFLRGTRPPGIGVIVIAIAPTLAGPDMIARLDAQLDRLAAGGVHIPGKLTPLDLPAEVEVEVATLKKIRAHAAG